MKQVTCIVLALVACAMTAISAGCVGVTNKSLRTNYSSYNETIHYNQNQQMLLNLVRLKYRQLPTFLKIGALSASYVFEVRGGADFGKAGATRSTVSTSAAATRLGRRSRTHRSRATRSSSRCCRRSNPTRSCSSTARAGRSVSCAT